MRDDTEERRAQIELLTSYTDDDSCAAIIARLKKQGKKAVLFHVAGEEGQQDLRVILRIKAQDKDEYLTLDDHTSDLFGELGSPKLSIAQLRELARQIQEFARR